MQIILVMSALSLGSSCSSVSDHASVQSQVCLNVPADMLRAIVFFALEVVRLYVSKVKSLKDVLVHMKTAAHMLLDNTMAAEVSPSTIKSIVEAWTCCRLMASQYNCLLACSLARLLVCMLACLLSDL
jgi:hypothetical protein